jgi:hypothetical protein
MSLDMPCLRFLDFPVTVRDQIYAELLVPPIVEVDEDHVTQLPPSINILYINKQIYAESSDVLYAKNLFTVISTNCPQLLCEPLRSKTPVFAEPKDTYKTAQCHRFAMTIEILGMHSEVATESVPAIVISAQALPFFATALIGKVEIPPSARNGLYVARMKTENSFRYSTSRFSNLTFGRLLTAKKYPIFNCLLIEGDISDEHRRAMSRSLLSEPDIACRLFGLSVDSLRHRIWSWMRRNASGDSNAEIKRQLPYSHPHELLRVLLNMYDMFWGCHEYMVRELSHDCIMPTTHQFTRMANMYNTLIQGYVFDAKCHPEYLERVIYAYTKALRTAEEGIAYLNRDDRLIYPALTDTKGVLKINQAKTALSLKAAKACRKLGDKEAAKIYIKDAALYSPSMSPSAADRLFKLDEKSWPAEPLITIKPVLWRCSET